MTDGHGRAFLFDSNMGNIILIRHGQANSAATDEESYDQLSDLGHRQAAWLGEYLRDTGQAFDHIHCGTLRRHHETVAGIAMGATVQVDARLNEMRYFDLAHAFNAQSGMDMPTCHATFAAHVPHVIQAWAAGDLDHVHQPYADFAQGIVDAVNSAAQNRGRHLFVTSGGVIAMLMAHVLGLSPLGHARIILPIHNSSITRFGMGDHGLHLDGFNATPHLDRPDRHHTKTHV
ncbi:MAG: histidine phosphatase family protein [Pseudomonadota bacterium]